MRRENIFLYLGSTVVGSRHEKETKNQGKNVYLIFESIESNCYESIVLISRKNFIIVGIYIS